MLTPIREGAAATQTDGVLTIAAAAAVEALSFRRATPIGQVVKTDLVMNPDNIYKVLTGLETTFTAFDFDLRMTDAYFRKGFVVERVAIENKELVVYVMYRGGSTRLVRGDHMFEGVIRTTSGTQELDLPEVAAEVSNEPPPVKIIKVTAPEQKAATEAPAKELSDEEKRQVFMDSPDEDGFKIKVSQEPGTTGLATPESRIAGMDSAGNVDGGVAAKLTNRDGYLS